MEQKKVSAHPENTRRQLLLGAAAFSTSFLAGAAFAEEKDKKETATTPHHHHASNQHNALIDAAQHCVKTGNACHTHCIQLVKSGDTSIAECLATVADMLPMCTTLAALASSQSPHLAAFAKVCVAVCEDCQKTCEEHKDKHAECKACAESCAVCIDECKKITA